MSAPKLFKDVYGILPPPDLPRPSQPARSDSPPPQVVWYGSQRNNSAADLPLPQLPVEYDDRYNPTPPQQQQAQRVQSPPEPDVQFYLPPNSDHEEVLLAEANYVGMTSAEGTRFGGVYPSEALPAGQNMGFPREMNSPSVGPVPWQQDPTLLVHALQQEAGYSETAGDFAWRTLLTCMLAVIPTVGYILGFTELGFGATVYKNLVHDVLWPKIAAGLGVGLTFALYLLDVTYWSANMALIKLLCLGIVCVAAGLAVVLSFKIAPYGPTMLYFVLCAGIYSLLYRTSYWSVPMPNYLKSVGIAGILSGVAFITTGFVWCGVNGYWYGLDSKAEFRDRLRVCEDMTPDNGYCFRYGQLLGVVCRDDARCNEIVAESACDPKQPTDCLAAMLLWGGMYVMGFFLLLVGAAMVVVTSSVLSAKRQTGQAADIFKSPLVRMFVLSLLILMGFIYVAASFNGASTDLAGLVVAFDMVVMFVVCMIFIGSVGWTNIHKAIAKNPKIQKVLAKRESDWLKAMFVLVVFPFLPLILIASAINQFFRQCLPCTKTLDEKERRLVLTLFMSNAIHGMKQWRWTSVLRKAITLGFVYFIMVVGIGKIANLFLAWLNIQLGSSGLNMWAVSGIVFGVGVLLFQIPVIPGAPIYLCCGVTVVSAAEPIYGFYIGCAWATFVACVCKLGGCFVQQKMVGELFSKSVTVKSMCAVNTNAIKAFRLVCQDKGMNFPLVVILVGGPDWPVAVMAGILRQSFIKMSIGSVPTIIPIAATVIAGALQLKVNEPGAYQQLSGVFLGVASFMFGFMTILFMVVLERITSQREAELNAIPDDEDVKEYDRISEIRQAASDEATDWSQMPLPFKFILILSVMVMWVATGIFTLFGSSTFRGVELTTDYRLEPYNGDVTNVILWPWGITGLILEAASLVIFYIWKIWAHFVTVDKIKGQKNVNQSYRASTESQLYTPPVVTMQHWPPGPVTTYHAPLSMPTAQRSLAGKWAPPGRQPSEIQPSFRPAGVLGFPPVTTTLNYPHSW